MTGRRHLPSIPFSSSGFSMEFRNASRSTSCCRFLEENSMNFLRVIRSSWCAPACCARSVSSSCVRRTLRSCARSLREITFSSKSGIAPNAPKSSTVLAVGPGEFETSC